MTYSVFDATGFEILNKTVDAVSFGLVPARGAFYLTAFTNETGVTHIFWEKSVVVFDIPERYWLYHESVRENGSVLVTGDLFYYETRGTGMPYPPNFSQTLPFTVGVSIVVLVVIGLAALLLRRRSRGA